MTHMHIPDGILPVWLWMSGFFLMFIALGISLARLKDMDMKVKLPLLAGLTAAMLVAMSLEIIPPAYHINLSVVTGILLGPALGFVSAFIANAMLALMGHGGITVMGLNTLLLGAEAVLGHALFTLIGRRIPIFWRAALSTVVTLLITTGLLIGIVAASGAIPNFVPEHEHEEMPLGGVSVPRFAIMVFVFGALGWFIEAAITGAVVRFIAQVKPDILMHVLHTEAGKGDEL